MQRIPVLILLFAAPLILTTLPTPQARTLASTGISGPQWIKYTQCYGPPNARYYNETETDTFNLTKDGTFVGPGLGLRCGPVAGGTNASATGALPVVSPLGATTNSTDLHWNETNQIYNSTTNFYREVAYHNVTERMYVNGKLFADYLFTFNQTFYRWNETLTCQPAAYPWTFTLSVSLTLKDLGVITNPNIPLICSTSSPGPVSLSLFNPNHPSFDSFSLSKDLNATYTPANQPSSLSKTMDLNLQPIDRTYLDEYSPALPPASCDGVLPFNQYTVPPPVAGDLGLGLSQDPVWAVQGTTQTFPLYLHLFPNNPPLILGDTLKIDAEANIPIPPVPPLPLGISLTFDAQPAVPSPNLGPSTIPALTSLTIPLQVTATAATPMGVYPYFLNVTDQTTGNVATWGIARIVICPAASTTGRPVTALQLLLASSTVGLLIAAEKRIKAARNLGRARSHL